jgi:hypothetical protein
LDLFTKIIEGILEMENKVSYDVKVNERVGGIG